MESPLASGCALARARGASSRDHAQGVASFSFDFVVGSSGPSVSHSEMNDPHGPVATSTTAEDLWDFVGRKVIILPVPSFSSFGVAIGRERGRMGADSFQPIIQGLGLILCSARRGRRSPQKLSYRKNVFMTASAYSGRGVIYVRS